MSIGFALAIPFVGLAFSIDEIGHGIVKVITMGQNRQEAGHAVIALGNTRWKPSRRFFTPGIITLALLITGLVFVLVWTSSLGTQSKVTVTICFAIFFVLSFIGRGLSKIVGTTYAVGDVSSSSSSGGSLVIEGP